MNEQSSSYLSITEVDAVRAEIAAAIADRPGWLAWGYGSISPTAHYTPDSDLTGFVVAATDGWHWSVWRGPDPLRSIQLPAAETLSAAMAKVESFCVDAVEHNPSSDADTELPYLTGQPVSFVDDGDGQATRP